MVLLASNNISAKLISFKNPVIHLLDGINFMIDGVAIHDMLVVIKKATTMHTGRRVGKNMVGNYTFNNQLYAIKDLAQIEEIQPDSKQLNKILLKSKHDFIAVTASFVDGIETAKTLILDLMHEFCERRNRPNSIILTWANAKAGGEEEVFSEAVKSFKDFDEFLGDLTLFLKDLVHSCPKAQEQYKEWYKKQKQSKAQ